MIYDLLKPIVQWIKSTRLIQWLIGILKKLKIFMCPTIIVGIIGFYGQDYVINIQQEYEHIKETQRYKRNALKSLRGFIKDIETLRINASMLHSALNRYSTNMNNKIIKNTLLERKKSYDSSYMHWLSTVQKNALFIRDAFQITYPTLYEYAVDEQLKFFFKVYDNYLTNYFDNLVINKKIDPSLDIYIKSFLYKTEKGLNLNQKISEKITRCTNEIFNATYDWIAQGKNCNHLDWNKSKMEEMYNTINSNDKCGFNQKPEPLSYTLFPFENAKGEPVNFCIQ